jgi:hypothetical protein
VTRRRRRKVANSRLQPETEKRCRKRWGSARPGRKAAAAGRDRAAASGEQPVGDFTTQTLTLGDSPPVRGVAVGCGHDNEVLFVGAAGLLALVLPVTDPGAAARAHGGLGRGRATAKPLGRCSSSRRQHLAEPSSCPGSPDARHVEWVVFFLFFSPILVMDFEMERYL